MPKITHEHVKKIIMNMNYNDDIGDLQDYILQQEKQDKLLELYRLGYSGSILSFIAYRDKIKTLEKELKQND